MIAAWLKSCMMFFYYRNNLEVLVCQPAGGCKRLSIYDNAITLTHGNEQNDNDFYNITHVALADSYKSVHELVFV